MSEQDTYKTIGPPGIKSETTLYGHREAASLKAIRKAGWPYLFLICLRLTGWRSL